MSTGPSLAAPPIGRRTLSSSADRNWRGIDAAFLHVPRGKAQVAGGARHVLGMHFGRPVQADCAVGDQRACGLQQAGDIDFIPAGVDGAWEDDADCQILRLSFDPQLLARVAEEVGQDPALLRPRLKLRDRGIEAILHAIKADLDAPMPSDPLYIDHLAHALAIRLLATAASDRATTDRLAAHAILRPEVSRVIDYIEANLETRLHLAELAVIGGISLTRLKIAFRATTGMPLHQYVLRRRVACARGLIATTTMPLAQIAAAVGFAHQSHMATMMRRLIGLTPSEIARPRERPARICT